MAECSSATFAIDPDRLIIEAFENGLPGDKKVEIVSGVLCHCL